MAFASFNYSEVYIIVTVITVSSDITVASRLSMFFSHFCHGPHRGPSVSRFIQLSYCFSIDRNSVSSENGRRLRAT